MNVIFFKAAIMGILMLLIYFNEVKFSKSIIWINFGIILKLHSVVTIPHDLYPFEVITKGVIEIYSLTCLESEYNYTVFFYTIISREV